MQIQNSAGNGCRSTYIVQPSSLESVVTEVLDTYSQLHPCYAGMVLKTF